MGNVGAHSFQWRYGRPLRSALPAFADGVTHYERSITLPTYDYTKALVQTTPDDPIYPYPRLDRERVGPPEPATYRLLVVENRFLQLLFLPELGGRLYQVVDKASGQRLFYQNPVIKPSPFGERGWWLGVGGMEWAVPTQEHGYLEYVPWDMDVVQENDIIMVRMSTAGLQSGMEVVATVRLRADESRFGVRLIVNNTTDQAHPLQMWSNAMVTPGMANRVGPDLRFVVPTDEMITHATQDGALPPPQASFPWPLLDGRDLAMPRTWNGYIGAFSPRPLPFFGVYDLAQDSGAAIIHNNEVPGAKIFGFSRTFDPSLYTDDQSDYVELWSGAQPTFWDNPPLAAGDQRSITTEWLSLWGIGDLQWATSDAAVGLLDQDDTHSTVVVATSRIINDATVVVSMNGGELVRTAALDLRPDQPLAIDLTVAPTLAELQVSINGLPVLPPMLFDN
ncbi:MAG: DUF5107 domain-containing protein [Chloroflexaceae bacterium]|nr:DUF5107 domain-containing protein [Chloroflexaceae bacterium]